MTVSVDTKMKRVRMEPLIMVDCNSVSEPFLIQLSEPIRDNVQPNDTKVTKVDAETTDDD